MKKIYLLMMSLLLLFKIYAQDSSRTNCWTSIFCCTGANCTGYPFSNVSVDYNISYAKTTNGYPGDITYAHEDGDGSCNPDAINVGCDKSGSVLFYDVHYPSDYANYKTCALPVVVFVHGGGYSDCAAFTPVSDECDYFAKRGFVCYNISYRIGTRITPDPGYPFVTVQQQLAAYRASQDVRGAIRSIIQRQMDQDGYADSDPRKTPYQVNTDWIFLAGASAGAITVLNVAYYDQNMLNTLNLYSGSYSIIDALGLIDADYYYGGTGIEYASKIRGVCDQWGSVSVPGIYATDSVHVTDFFSRRIPVIAFHGQRDPVVRFYIFPANFAQTDIRMPTNFGNTYVSETSCLLLTNGKQFKTDNKKLNNPDFATYGSFSFYNQILQPLNIPSELYIDCQAFHGLDNDGPNYHSDYGTCYHTQTQTTEYIVERAVVFFKNIMTNNNLSLSYAQKRQDKVPATVKVFVDCRNNVTCRTTTDNNNGCHNDDKCDGTQVCPN